MALERNPAYHGRFAGNVSRIELSFTSRDSASPLQMYEEDRLDALPGFFLLPAELDRAQQAHAGDYVSGPALGTFYVRFQADRPPFDDPRVRRALALATDKETLAISISSYFLPATGGLVPPGMPGHSPAIGLSHDPERACRLLAEAGYPGGHGFPVLDAPAPEVTLYDPVIESLQAQWLETLGIEVTWKQMDWERYLDRLAKEPPLAYLSGWWTEYPDPHSFMRDAVAEGRTSWQNRDFDALVEGARRVTNQEERMRMYRRADRILVEEALLVPLLYGRRHLLVKPWVSKYPMSPIQDSFWKDVVIEPH